MEKITNIFATNQISKKILTELTQVLLYQPNMHQLTISKENYDALIRTLPPAEQVAKRRTGLKLLGVPIVERVS